jgi:hypothetical protein
LAAYAPGNYDPGFGGLGGVAFTNWYLGGVYFDMEKPYGKAILPSNRQIWFKSAYNVVGYFVNGGVYTITYTINWAQKTSVVRIVGDGGVDITLNNHDDSINKSNFTGLNLTGPQFTLPTHTLFDTIVIGEPSQPITGDFNADGVVNLDDYAIMARSWDSILGGDNWNADCNLNDSGDSESKIDTADLVIFCENWLMGI